MQEKNYLYQNPRDKPKAKAHASLSSKQRQKKMLTAFQYDKINVSYNKIQGLKNYLYMFYNSVIIHVTLIGHVIMRI